MSEIKNAGIKGYIVLGAVITTLLIVALLVYVYKENNDRVPQEPMLYSQYIAAKLRMALTA